LPLIDKEVDTSVLFSPEELLYRRVNPSHLNTNGELGPETLNTFSFEASIESAPSVNRSQFSQPEDVIHINCACGKDVSGYLVYSINVVSLPTNLEFGSKVFRFFPVHIPLALCGAHSVISCCYEADSYQKYEKPPRPVRNAFRTLLATKLRKHV